MRMISILPITAVVGAAVAQAVAAAIVLFGGVLLGSVIIVVSDLYARRHHK
jgi:hypothetical protein